MLKIYFGEWGSGKLQRLPYLGYHVLLIVMVVAVIFAGLIAVGTLENTMGGNLAQTQAMLMDKFGIVAMVLLSALVFIVILGQVNILGKRIRDIGLPVLSTIFAIIALSMVLNYLFPPELISLSTSSVQTDTLTASSMAATAKTDIVVQIFDSVIFLALLFLPSNTFRKKEK